MTPTPSLVCRSFPAARMTAVAQTGVETTALTVGGLAAAGAYKTHVLSVNVELGPHDAVPQTLARHVSVEYTMNNSTVSHAQVRSVAVTPPQDEPPYRRGPPCRPCPSPLGGRHAAAGRAARPLGAALGPLRVRGRDRVRGPGPLQAGRGRGAIRRVRDGAAGGEEVVACRVHRAGGGGGWRRPRSARGRRGQGRVGASHHRRRQQRRRLAADRRQLRLAPSCSLRPTSPRRSSSVGSQHDVARCDGRCAAPAAVDLYPLHAPELSSKPAARHCCCR